jgi:hypothetical protein
MAEPAQSQLSTAQKTGFVFLLVFAVGSVGLGFVQLRNTVYRQILVKGSTQATATITLDETTRLQRIDTDRDGLNDYEELNFYQTSPYLPDTDSDGIGDEEEVRNGGDPLCPKGKECGNEQLPDPNDIDELTSPLGDVVTPEDVLNQAFASEQGEQQVGAYIEGVLSDPAELRKQLLATGQVTEAQLKDIDDATLLEMVKALLEEEGAFEQ